MLSIGRLSSASGAANYFIKGGEGKIAGYYSEHQEASGWGGDAKEILGLKDGPVDLETFEALLDGYVSDTQRLGRKVKGEWLRDPGRDFTFSAPKSVSAAAIGALEKPIIDAFARSVETTMSYYQDHLAQARISNKETKKQPKTGGQKILYATFMDFLSRANDPQLHIHTPVVNIAIGEDHKIRSLNFDMAYKHKVLLGNIQRAELANELKSLGLSIRPAGKNGLWELEGSSTEILTKFSKRRQNMVRQVPHKIGDAAAMAHMAKITRPAKETISREALRARWSAEFKALGTSIKDYTQAILDAPKRDRADLTPKAAINYAVSHLSESQAHFDRLELLKHAMVSTYGNVNIKSMEAELGARVEKGELLISDDRRWIKPGSIHRLEQKLIGELKKGHTKAKVITSDAFEKEQHKFGTFTPGQKNAAKLILTDSHRFSGIDGVAGSGKTYLLETALPLLKASGYEIIGMAPTDKAVKELAKTNVFDQLLTVQMFHKAPRGGSKTVLVVDEAGMAGNEKLHSIMNYANLKNMPKVVLMGDKHQLPPIEAGRPFALLQENGLKTVNMDNVVRQKKEHHRKGVLELSQHNVREAFQTFKKEIHEVPRDQLESYAIKLRDKMQDPSIIVNTNAQRVAINKSISSEIETQLYSGPSFKQKIWTPVYMSKAQKMKASEYVGASHIRFTRDVGKDFKRGEIYRITKVDHDRAELILKNGRHEKAFRPARHGSGDSFTQVYNQSEITLHKGDKIRFRQKDKKLGISNNDQGKIINVSDGRVVVALDDKKPISFPRGHRMLGHLDHAWANTTYSFQGVTVENNIAIMKADNNPLNTLEAFYVGTSRHKDNLAIITDNKDQLLRVISEKLDLASERIVFKEPRKMQVVDPQTIISQENTSSIETEKSQELEKTYNIKQRNEVQRTQETEKPYNPQRERGRGDRGR